MAQFYQEPNPSNDPNYLGSSKEPERIQADTSLGGLFAGIGDITNKIGPAIESGFKERIKDTAHSLIDPIMDQHGTGLSGEDVKGIAGTGAKGRVRALQMKGGTGLFGDETDSGVSSFSAEEKPDVTAGGIFPDDKARPLPSGAQREVTQLQRMTAAYHAGNLSDSYYTAQMLAVSKELRARYPGFREEVDNAVSQITGIQPANALRSSLVRDIQYNQAAMLAAGSSDDKFRDKYRAEINVLGYNDQTPIETVKPAVSQYIGQREILKATQLRAEVGSPQAEAALSDTIAGSVNSFITQKSNQAQGTKSFADYQADAQKMTLNGGGSPKEVNEFVNGLKLARAGLEAQIRAEIYKPIEGRKDGHSLVTLVKEGDQKLGPILTQQLKPIDDMIALASAGNFSALQQTTDMIKHQGNLDVQNLYRAFPQSRVAASINNAFPNNPIFSNRFIEQTNILPDFGKAIKNGLGNAILGGSATTPAPTPSEAVKLYGPDLEKSGAVYKETIKQYNMVVSPENKNIPNATHVAKQFFGDQAFYDNLNDSGRLKLFMTMASPEKTKFIQELAKTDPEVLGRYQQWTKYAAGDIFRRNSSDLQDMITNKGLDLRFNPTTLQFTDNTKYDRDTVSQRQRSDSDMKIRSINNALTLMQPIVGSDAKSLLGALGIDPLADKEDGVLGSIVKSIGDKIQDWGNEADREAIKRGSKPVGKQSVTPQRQGQPHQTRDVIQGNLSDSTLVSADPFAIPDGMSPQDFIAELKKRHKL